MLRVREPLALYDENIGTHVVPKLSELFEDDDPLVKQHRWAFATEEELTELAKARLKESVEIEQATRAPGERSRARRK